MHEAMEMQGVATGYVRRNMKSGNVTKASPQTLKPAGLSKPGKKDTPRVPSPSKAAKLDATKEVAVPKSVTAVQKVVHKGTTTRAETSKKK